MKLGLRPIFRLFLFLCVVAIFPQKITAQVSEEGTPLSMQATFRDFLQEKAKIVDMPAVDVARLRREDLENDGFKEIPWRFGENIDTDLGIRNSGTWTTLPDGSRVWRLSIRSNGAYHINLTFDRYKLEKGAKLFIHNSDFSHIIGAFTEKNNQEDYMFGTTLVKGNTITLEYQVPAGVSEGELHINRVTHGYRDAYAKALDAFGSSGSCNVNVNCPAGADWACTKKSVCMLVSGGNGFCTGTLLNNTANDAKPYVITANHCYSNPSTWVFWFNWDSPTCANPASAPTPQVMSGATLRARRANTDFCLVEINQAIPSTIDVIYAGWNRSTDNPTRLVCIHHPSGDIKKISFADVVTSENSGPLTTGNGWRAFWRATGGITEPGSSGSAVFDTMQRFVGQLYGGPSSCTATGTNRSDYFGKFAMSWANGTTTADQASSWLDPLNTGAVAIDALGCSGFSLSLNNGAGTVCQTGNTSAVLTARSFGTFSGSTVNLSISGAPAGVTATLVSSSLVPTSTTPATTTLNISVANTTAQGVYPITVTGTSGAMIKTTVFTLTVAATPSVSTLSTPANNATGVASTPVLVWNTTQLATAYDVELAIDSAAAARVFTSNNVAATTVTVTPSLNSTTVYYWRVRAKNSCGTGAWSFWWRFTTNACLTYMSTDVPKLISDLGTSTVTSTLTLSTGAVINTIDVVNVQGTHTYNGDIDFALIAPNNTTLTLRNRVCAAAADFSFSISDAATATTHTCTSPVGSGDTYRPIQALSALSGLSVNGIWTMRVRDLADGDGGSLNSWGLRVCPANDYSVATTRDTSNILCSNTANTVTVPITYTAMATFSGAVALTTATLPTGITVNFAANTINLTAGSSVTSNMTVNVAAGTAAGNYTVTLRATSGSIVRVLNYVVRVSGVPNAPTLLLPLNNATTVAVNNATFNWSPVASAASYQIEIANDAAFTSIVNTGNPTTISFTNTVALQAGTVYWWRVKAISPCGQSAWTSRIFQTAGADAIPTDIPTEAGNWVATAETTVSGWTHYTKPALTAPITRRNLLILSVKKDAALQLVPSQVSVLVNTPNQTTQPIGANKYIVSPTSWHVINRSWKATPTTQPTAPIAVRFYYTTAEYNALRANAPSLTSHDSILVYKFTSGTNIDPNPTLGHSGAFAAYFEDPTYTHSTWGTHHYAEFGSNDLSGGGAGAGSIPLLVEWGTFAGTKGNTSNQLTWQTVQERKTTNFVLEYSRDGQNYKTVATKTARGMAVASFNFDTTHIQGFAAKHFYRLRINGQNGRFAYAPTIVLLEDAEANDKKVKYFPNPTDKDLTLFVIGDNESVDIVIYNDLGQAVQSGTYNSNGAITIPMQNLASGMYIIKINSPSIDKSVKVQKQ